MMDVNGDNNLDPDEVKKVLESTPLTKKINDWSREKMNKIAKKAKGSTDSDLVTSAVSNSTSSV